MSAVQHAPGPLLCVVGVRTSGSYLAPLCAAALRAAGVTSVAVLTYRPGRPLRRAEAKTDSGRQAMASR